MTARSYFVIMQLITVITLCSAILTRCGEEGYQDDGGYRSGRPPANDDGRGRKDQ